ncbi:MAG TPA: sugar phosphate isomerase/epimerase, partial [Prolixibacteraceae bacterium]|nr:sugar phosphate isomerase/epimerase [Prolixibacteraceae bacterium]
MEKKGATSQVELKISCQEGVAPGKTLTEKLDFMEQLGIVGLEVWGGGLENRVNEIQDALKNRSIKVSAICAGFGGWLIADDPAVRQTCIDSMRVILEAAGALGSTGLIFVPAFNNQPSLPHKESRELLVEELKELAAFAAEKSTRLLLEPLNRGECYFCRQVADA